MRTVTSVADISTVEGYVHEITLKNEKVCSKVTRTAAVKHLLQVHVDICINSGEVPFCDMTSCSRLVPRR